MKKLKGKPVSNSDWKLELDFQIDGSLKVITCAAGPGKHLPAVEAGKRYAFTGETPARLVISPGLNRPAPFLVYEVEKLENGA
jgi:hypothetical protein